MPALRIAAFQADVTPPIGHPLCAGWLGTAIAVTDPLQALGVILWGDGKPVVLCALDWCEINNRSHMAWRDKLAKAAGTTPDRVAVHCMHPHCTPWPDEEAQKLLETQPDLRPLMDTVWCAQALDGVARAVAAATKNSRPFTHIGQGRAKVDQVASNRRVMGPDGKVKAVRWTATKDPAVRAEPEGLIDPWLKTVSFWNENQKLAVLEYYAVHDTSYDKDCRITCDFTGLARNRRAAEDGVPHIYFNECAGNITAGKYNNGAPENRPVLTERIYRAMVESERKVERIAANGFDWRVEPVCLPPLVPDDAALLAILRDPSQEFYPRCRAAMQISYLRRKDEPILFTRLRLSDRVNILHLPGEPFIEYQLFAQQQRPDDSVLVAGYGDCGTGYVCMEKSFAEGGYEPTDAFVAGESESIMKETIAKLLR